jgi:hypothetical protein
VTHGGRLILGLLILGLVGCGDGDCRSTSGGPPIGDPEGTPTPEPATVLAVFDANLLFTDAVFVPLAGTTAADLEPLTAAAWTDAARPVSRIAADGVSLLILRAELAAADTDPVTFSLHSNDRPTGGLFAIDDQGLLDTSEEGGEIGAAAPGQTALAVDSVVIGGARWAFALYRAPRDFDVTDGSSDALRNYPVDLALAAGDTSAMATITVVRPLVVLVHGTLDDNSAWIDFDLWEGSANDINGFDASSATLPFDVDRISYQWIRLSAGPMAENGATIVPQLTRALQNWRQVSAAAGTQADVITHSFGGPVTRQATQTQADMNPLVGDDQRNFRSATNWGHGTIHKLITLSGSHRGSPLANLVSLVNANGINGTSDPGLLRTILCLDGADVGAGALGDQRVLSPALRALRQTRVPAHAFAGSGLVQNEAPELLENAKPSVFGLGTYHGEYWSYQCLATTDGPYGQAGQVAPQSDCIDLLEGSGPSSPFDYCAYNRLVNYAFSLDYDVPALKPVTEDPDCSPVVGPASDLTVSTLSAQGMLPDAAFTTVGEIDAALVGHVNHTEMRSNPMVSSAVTALLHESTSSASFAHFPATGMPTVLESQLQQVGSPAGLELGSACSAPPVAVATSCYLLCSQTPGNIPCFREFKVHPTPLVVRGNGIPAPIFIYALVDDPNGGPLNGKWVDVQSVSREFWCTVTMQSSTPAVAAIQTEPPADLPVVVGVADGTATVTIKVETRVLPVIIATIDVPVTIEPLLPTP